MKRLPFDKPAPQPKKTRRPPTRKSAPRRRNAKRAAETFIEDFGSVEYVKFIQSQRCGICGIYGYSVAAHLTPRSVGGTVKDVAPLCDSLHFVGCHKKWDDHDPHTREWEPQLRGLASLLHAQFFGVSGDAKGDE
jgi:hypothetical protein